MLMVDSGVRSGLDIARAIACGADFVLLGRAFMFGVAALGSQGGNHVVSLLRDELENTMVQLGIENLTELRKSRVGEINVISLMSHPLRSFKNWSLYIF